jgi:hypothetical protein
LGLYPPCRLWRLIAILLSRGWLLGRQNGHEKMAILDRPTPASQIDSRDAHYTHLARRVCGSGVDSSYHYYD